MTEVEVDSAPLRDVAYRLLRAEIIACRLAPGQRTTERQLAAQTGLGISPIREALTRLDHEGLVRTLPRKGYQVKPLTMKSVDDLFVSWEVFGPEVARLGLARATPEQIEQIRNHFDTLVRWLAENATSHDLNRRAIQIVDDAFAVLAEATQNDYLVSMFHQLSGEISRVWALIMEWDLAEVGHFTAETAEWADLLSRIDGQAAAEVARRHIEGSHNRCLRALARWPSIVASELVLPSSPGHP